MLFWCVLLLFMIIILGRYTVNGTKLMPEIIAFPYVECVLIIFTIFRYNVGFDWPTYYLAVSSKLDMTTINQFELIPRLICKLSNKLNAPILVFVLHGIPTYLLLFISFKNYSCSRYESLLIFFCVFYLESLSTIRQWLAISILFFGFKFVRERKILQYLIISILAFFCHKSSIFASVLIYIIYNFKYDKIIFILSVFLIFFGNKLINFASTLNIPYVWYLSRLKNYTGGEMIKYFYVLLISIVYWLTKGTNCEKIKKLRVLVLFGIIFPFLFGAHLGSRIGVYFYFYFVLLIPEVLNYVGNEKFRKLFMCGFYLYFILLLYVNSKNISVYIPYRFYPLINFDNEFVKPR